MIEIIKKEDYNKIHDPITRLKLQQAKLASGMLEDCANLIIQSIEFRKGKNDVQKWVEQNRKIKGRPFDYEDANVEMMLGEKDKKIEKAPRPYLRQYINDNTRDKSVIKCRQSELTETEINENIWIAATQNNLNVRHVFPTSGLANKIAKEKITPAIDTSPDIKKLLKRPYSQSSKEFVTGSFYTVDGSWTDHGGRGPSSDKITFDEYESQNPKIEEVYSESTSHSKLGRRTRISTPMFPNAGIDLMYNRGCQYEWIVYCPKCNKEQIMEFPDNLINYFEANDVDIVDENYENKLNKIYIGCRFCGEYIDRVSEHYLKNSLWIAKRPKIVTNRVSYRISYFMLPWKTGKEIAYKYHSFRFKHQFWNEIIGAAYVDVSSKLGRGLFEQCIDTGFRNAYQAIGNLRNVSVGVDWGMTSWVVVSASGIMSESKKRKVIYIERIDNESLKNHGYAGMQTEHEKRVEEIANFFKARIIVNDANGIGVDRNSHLVNKYPNKAWGCFYDTDEVQKQKRKERLIIPTWSEAKRTVTVSRLSSFKLLLDEYREKKVTIPFLDPVVEEFIEHHTNLIIQMMQDDNLRLYEIVGKLGADHYSHADNYSKIGWDKLTHSESRLTAGIISTPEYSDEQDSDNVYNTIKKYSINSDLD